MTKDDLGHLVLTLSCGENGEAMTLLAHTPDGPVPVHIEVGVPKMCRCGASTRNVKVRVVAPKSVRISRVARAEVPA